MYVLFLFYSLNKPQDSLQQQKKESLERKENTENTLNVQN